MIILFHYPLPHAPWLGLPQSASCLLSAVDLATATTKLRYKTRYSGRVAANMDALIASGGPDPRIPRGGGLDQGGQAHLLDAARMLQYEGGRITPVQIANCWMTAEVLPVEAAAEVRRQLQGVLHVADSVHTDVSDVVSLLANAGLDGDVEGMS